MPFIPPYGSAPTPDATASVKGKVQLAGDLAGTAAAPTVTDLTITSEAQGDILYRNAANWVRLAASTSGFYLKTQGAGADPVWAAVTAGDNTYDAVVAASGGDYTTLGAALAAGSSGWRILVRDATTEVGAISSSLTNLTIIGDNRKGAVVNLGANPLTLSGVFLNISNVGFNISNNAALITFSGADSIIQNNLFDLVSGTPSSSTGDRVSVSGAQSFFIGNTIVTTSTSQATANYLNANANGLTVDNNVFNTGPGGTVPTSRAVVEFSSTGGSFSGNYLTIPTMTNGTSGYTLHSSNDSSRVNGNYFAGFSTTIDYTTMYLAGSDCTVNDNTIIASNKGIETAGGDRNVISGNAIRLADTGNSAVAINLSNGSDDYSVIGNIISSSDGTNAGTGIQLNGGDRNMIVGNKIKDVLLPIDVNSTSADNTLIMGNLIYDVDNTANTIEDSGVATMMLGNYQAKFINDKQVYWMKNTSGATINAGNIVTFKTGVAAGDEVTTTTTVSDNYVFGMAISAITNNSYGMILTKGSTTLLTVNGTTDIAIGDYITTYSAAGIGAKAAVGTVGTLPGDLAIAIALEAYTGNDSNGVIDAILISPLRT